jgi:hypothetical protein
MVRVRIEIMSTRRCGRKLELSINNVLDHQDDPTWLDSMLKEAGFDLSVEITHLRNLDNGDYIYIQYYEEE